MRRSGARRDEEGGAGRWGRGQAWGVPVGRGPRGRGLGNSPAGRCGQLSDAGRVVSRCISPSQAAAAPTQQVAGPASASGSGAALQGAMPRKQWSRDKPIAAAGEPGQGRTGVDNWGGSFFPLVGSGSGSRCLIACGPEPAKVTVAKGGVSLPRDGCHGKISRP
jgi:hypothetical protein